MFRACCSGPPLPHPGGGGLGGSLVACGMAWSEVACAVVGVVEVPGLAGCDGLVAAWADGCDACVYDLLPLVACALVGGTVPTVGGGASPPAGFLRV